MKTVTYYITALLLFAIPALAADVMENQARLELAAKATVALLLQKSELRIDLQSRKAWIDPTLWMTMDAFHKETITRMFALYCDSKYPSVTVYNKQSARELASYGPFQGFRIAP